MCNQCLYECATECHKVGLFILNLAARLDWTADRVHLLSLAYQRPNGSPTDLLLLEWGHTNATVEMLVFHLLEMKLPRAAELFRGLGKFYFSQFML
jgi:hypothetical protein